MLKFTQELRPKLYHIYWKKTGRKHKWQISNNGGETSTAVTEWNKFRSKITRKNCNHPLELNDKNEYFTKITELTEIEVIIVKPDVRGNVIRVNCLKTKLEMSSQTAHTLDNGSTNPSVPYVSVAVRWPPKKLLLPWIGYQKLEILHQTISV